MAVEIPMPVYLRVGDAEVEAGTITLDVVAAGADLVPNIREALAGLLREVAECLDGPEQEVVPDAPA